MIRKLDAQKIPVNYVSAIGSALEGIGGNKARLFSELGISVYYLEKPDGTVRGTQYKNLIEKGISLNDSSKPFIFL